MDRPCDLDSAIVSPEHLVGQFVEALRDDDTGRIRDLVGMLHPADAADLLEQVPHELFAEALEMLEPVLLPETIAELCEDLLPETLAHLSDSYLIEALETLDSGPGGLLLEALPESRRAGILSRLDIGDRDTLESALSFDEDSVGRLMHKEFVAAPHFWTVGQAIDHMRRIDDLPDIFYEIYLVDADFKLLGAAPVSSVLRASREVMLSSLHLDSPVIFHPESDQEEVAYAFQQYNLASAPVVDADGRLTGMVTVDDMLDVIQEENREDLLALSGVSVDVDISPNRTIRETVRGRAPWLGVNLGTAFLASAVIRLFDYAIEAMVALAILMPVIVALGGNAGAQALAVAVRGIAERELTPATAMRAIRCELLAACVNGVIFATGIAVITLIWFADPGLAGVIASATFLTIVWAATAGVLIPLGLNRLGVDPAVASSVFVLATVDVVGFFSFLGLASLLLIA